jgi:hypothetical protein
MKFIIDYVNKWKKKWRLPRKNIHNDIIMYEINLVWSWHKQISIKYMLGKLLS